MSRRVSHSAKYEDRNASDASAKDEIATGDSIDERAFVLGGTRYFPPSTPSRF
jgi:hypothetical protein